MNTSRQNNISKEDLYKKYLNIFSGIKFTLREIDIMSCVLHNRGNKKTADILSISYRTVETHIRNIIGKINKATRDDIIDFIEKSQVLSHFKTYYTWVITNYYFKNCLLKIASINQQKLHYAITDKMTSMEDQSYSVFTEKLQNMQKDLQLANIILTVKKSTTDHYFTLEPEGSKVSHKKIVIVFDNTNIKDTSGIIYIDFRGNYYLSILNLLETIIPKEAEVKKIIQEFKDQYFNLQGVSDLTITAKNTEKHTNKRVFIKYLIAALVIVIMALAVIFFFQKRDKLSPEPNIHNSSHRLSVDKNLHTWDLPYFNLEHYVNRTEIIKTITSRFTKKENIGNQTVFIGLYGLAGMGKTTLAKYLIHHPVKKYDFKGWFNAENDDFLKNSYISIGEKYHLFSRDTPEHQKIDKIKAWLNSQEDLLIVYDNAPDATILKKYLPNHGHIIITSRNYKLPGALALESMTQKESIALLLDLIPQKTMENQQAVNTLIETMGHLPLALSQAGAYIADNEMTISAYLSLYERARKKLLSDKTLPAMEEHEPIYIAWNLIIKALKQKPNQEKIFQLMGFIGQCYREEIPKKLLSQYLYGSTESDGMIELNTVFKSLKEYSLIKVYDDTISIHPLLHSFFQDLFADNTHKIQIIKKSIDTMVELKSLAEVPNNFAKLLFPHVESIFKHAQTTLKAQEYNKLILILAHISYTIGHYTFSYRTFKRALELQTKNFGDDHIENAKILGYLGKIEVILGYYDDSKKHLMRALEIQRKHYGLNSIKTTHILIALAKLEGATGHYLASHEMLEKALHIQKQNVNQNDKLDSNTIKITLLLGVNNLFLENYEVSDKLISQALSMAIERYGKKHMFVNSISFYLARAKLGLGNYQESIKLFKAVLTVSNQYFGLDHPDGSSHLHFLGKAQAMVGSYKESQQSLEKSLTIQESYFGANHARVAETLHTLGELHMKLSNDQESQKLLERALKIQENNFGSDNNKVADILYSLGDLNIKTGNYQAAKKFLERSLQIHKKYFGADHKKVKRTKDVLQTIGLIVTPHLICQN